MHQHSWIVPWNSRVLHLCIAVLQDLAVPEVKAPRVFCVATAGAGHALGKAPKGFCVATAVPGLLCSSPGLTVPSLSFLVHSLLLTQGKRSRLPSQRPVHKIWIFLPNLSSCQFQASSSDLSDELWQVKMLGQPWPILWVSWYLGTFAYFCKSKEKVL